MLQSEAELRSALDERSGFEALQLDLSTSFVALPADQVDGAIEDAQRRIVETLALDRCSLFQYTAEGEMVLTHTWGSSRVPAVSPPDLCNGALSVVNREDDEGRSRTVLERQRAAARGRPRRGNHSEVRAEVECHLSAGCRRESVRWAGVWYVARGAALA